MPRLLVLLPLPTEDLLHRADTIVAGARSVRFAEVELRRLADAGAGSDELFPDARARLESSCRALEGLDALASYDGIIVGVRSKSDADRLRESIASVPEGLVNKVGSAFVDPSIGEAKCAVLWDTLRSLADRGMLLVPPPDSASEGDREATHLHGKRVAEVVGWITHARSHHHHH